MTPDGRLRADSATIARLQRLCAEDAAALEPRPPREPCRPAAAVKPTDEDIEQVILGLIAEAHREAMRSFELARNHTRPGELVDMRDIHVHQGERLARAVADLTVALARHRGKPQKLILEHFVHRGV
jgi:hypothetical protein